MYVADEDQFGRFLRGPPSLSLPSPPSIFTLLLNTINMHRITPRLCLRHGPFPHRSHDLRLHAIHVLLQVLVLVLVLALPLLLPHVPQAHDQARHGDVDDPEDPEARRDDRGGHVGGVLEVEECRGEDGLWGFVSLVVCIGKGWAYICVCVKSYICFLCE